MNSTHTPFTISINSNNYHTELFARYECDGNVQYQEIQGGDIAYSFDYFPDTSVGEFRYIPKDSFLEIGIFGDSCFLFSRMEFGVGLSGQLKLEFSRASFTLNYDKTKVEQGSRNFGFNTTKFNWITFGNNIKSDSTSFFIQSIPIYPSSVPTKAPTAAPTVSFSPSAVPSFTPAPTKSAAPTENEVTDERNITSGSSHVSPNFMVSLGVMIAAIFVSTVTFS